MLTKLILVKALQAVGAEVAYTQVCYMQWNLQTKKIEQNSKWYLLKSPTGLHLFFSAMVSCLILLFSVSLQDKMSFAGCLQKGRKSLLFHA